MFHFLFVAASVHVKFKCIGDYMAKSNEIKKFFHKEGIHSTTIQLEFEDEGQPSGSKCMIVCTGESCADRTCCNPDESATTVENNSLGSTQDN